MSSLARRLTVAAETNSDETEERNPAVAGGRPASWKPLIRILVATIDWRSQSDRHYATALQIADLLPHIAEQMHFASLVRSVTSKEGDHARGRIQVKTGFRPDPSLKHPIDRRDRSVMQTGAGADIPRHVSILPGRSPARGGYLGTQYDAFKIL